MEYIFFMKGKNTQETQDWSHEVSIANGHAMVKYAHDISYAKLLDIFWIPADRGDIIRSLIKGNGLAYNPSNAILSLENGKLIPNGYLIKLPTRNVSTKVIQAAEAKNKPKTPDTAKVSDSAKQTSTGVRAEISALLQDKTVKYSLFGGTAVAAIIVSASVAFALSVDTPVKKKHKTPVEEVIAEEEDEPLTVKNNAPEIAWERPQESWTESLPPMEKEKSKQDGEKNITADHQNLTYPEKNNIDMSQVGALTITPNSKSKDIAELIKAWNKANNRK